MMKPFKQPDEPPRTLVSYSRPAPGLSTAAFLRQAYGQERFFWADGRDGISLAGFGVAAELIAWGENRFQAIESQARQLFQDAILLTGAQALAAPRLFGGFAFSDDFTPDNTWSVFHPAHFILPHYQLLQIGSESWLTINALLPPEDRPADSLPQLREALDARYELLRQAEMPPATPTAEPVDPQVRFPMPYTAWQTIIEEAIRQMAGGDLEKVVLSRVCEIRLSQRVDVDAALAYLQAHYSNCYRFLFEPRPYHAFYGATPELLARVDGRTVTTMSLAGSIRRGAAPAEDEALGEHLRHDPKERHEHALVTAMVKKRLRGLTDFLLVGDEPGLYKLSNIQHLYTPIRGRLRQAEGVLPVVAALHPTPALGGSPQTAAMAFIRQAEPVPRGWYAAPIGWLDHKLEGMFSVAIRSAVSQGRRVWLYAGAGIVARSQPRQEWDETALKFKPMLDALGIDRPVEEGSHVHP